MYGHQRYGIIRRNGFLYLNDNKEIKFRTPGTLSREIKQIAPEELGAGMLEILKQNMTADKTGLYQSMAHLCGVSRVGKTINAQFDLALQAISEYIVMDGDVISLK